MNSLENLAIQLIQQPSISPKDHNCQNIIAKFLKKLNFTIEPMNFEDTTNIWAYRGYKKKQHTTLLFLGHTDVVTPGNLENWNYPPFSGLIQNNILYGRGAADMKGALAAMLIAVKNFIKKWPSHPQQIAFLITSDEEGIGTNGTKKVVESLIKRQEKIDYCIIGEPSSQRQIGDIIKNGRRGSLMGTLTIYGIQGHVAYPQFSYNPIHAAIPVLSTLLTTTWDQKTSIFFPPTTLQITDINTNNNNNNIVPHQVTLNFNFRFNDQCSIHDIQQHINKIMKHNQLTYHINFKLSAESYLSKPGKLTNIVIDIINEHQKITPTVETTGGTSDGRFISKMGTEIVELGALNHTIHKINECICLTDLKTLSIIYQKIIEKLFLPI